MDELHALPYTSISGALEYHARVRAEKPALLYPDAERYFAEYASFTYEQLNRLVHHLAKRIVERLPEISAVTDQPVTCGILAAGGMEYLLCQLALLKLPNVILFPISSRNSQAAVEHLIRKTKTMVLFTVAHFLPMVTSIQEQEEFQCLKVLLFDSEAFDMQGILQKKDEPCEIDSSSIMTKAGENDSLNRVVIILHSSGSTAHPKPIYLTNRYFLLMCFTYTSINQDFWNENDVLLVWGALFHLMAVHGLVRALVSGCTYALPLCATFPPKPDELLRNLQVPHGITVLLTVPSLLEQVTRDLCSEKNAQIGLKPLINLRFILYGGASCPDEVCKALVDHGVLLLSLYGSTETGIVLGKNFNPYDKRWKYMQFPEIRKPYVRIQPSPHSQNPDEKLVIYLPNDPFLAENIANTPDGSYMPSDILLEDPPNSGQYLILGRQDDTLVHLNGEKTNPLPMEEVIRCCPLVKQVAIVGHNEFCTAALIQLNIDEAMKYEFKEIEEKIWHVIERANQQAPSHSRLVRQLIKILPMNRVLPVTDKGNLMRGRVHMEYLEMITNLYDQFLERQQHATNPVDKQRSASTWTCDRLQQYLMTKLKSMVTITDDLSRSIFDFGVNSLQVMQLRNAICQDICPVPKSFIYEYSSIGQMIEALINRVSSSLTPDDPHHYTFTEQLIQKYTTMITQEVIPGSSLNTHRKMDKRVFLVTGANGSLGSFIVRDLLRQPSSTVKRVYCHLRGTNTKQRLFEAFEQRHLDTKLLINALEKKQPRLVILPSSSSMDLNQEITDIIHSAWKMNFNQTVKDFEHDCILNIYNLLKFAATNRTQFHFISSIASAGSGVLNVIKEERLPRRAEIALPQGYGQSKYVSEHMCWTAMDVWNVPVNVYRLGQISGDTQNGIWNSSELASMMIYAGAGQLKKLPDHGDDIRWIPVDVCSAAVVELALNSSFDLSISKEDRIYHLLNPHVTLYEEYLRDLESLGLEFERVSSDDFVTTLLTIGEEQKNPLVKLGSFLEHFFKERPTRPFPRYEMVKTMERSDTLKQCPRMDSAIIQRYVEYWKQCGLLNP